MSQFTKKSQEVIRKQPQHVEEYRKQIGQQQEKVLHQRNKSPLTLDKKDKPIDEGQPASLGLKVGFVLFWIVLIFVIWKLFDIKAQSIVEQHE